MVTRAGDSVLSEAEEEYRKRTPRSAEVFDRALKTFPGGAFRRGIFIGPYAPVIDRAEGAYLYDLDGNGYLDLNGNWTSMVVGHSHPKVVAAVQEAAARSLALSAPTENAVELAEVIKERVSSIETLRFACSGTEAV